MSWIVPENKLDDQQRNFIENVDIDRANMWIKGFPGSGKSVLLAYTIKRIRRKHPDAKILVVVFTHSLIKMFQAAFAEMGVVANIVTYYAFMKETEHYDYILSDEVQDMTSRVLDSMRKRGSHVVVAGDENQSIYDSDPKYDEPTVSTSDIRNLLGANEYELGIIHRLSSSIINAVQRFLPNMNVFSAKRDLSKQSTQIRLCEAKSKEEEVRYIFREAKKAINVGQTVAILIPTHDTLCDFIQNIIESEGKSRWSVSKNSYGKVDYRMLNEYLSQRNIPVQYIGSGCGSFSENSRMISVMTYHSSKGLDFDNVFIPGLDSALFVSRNETLSKTLFMVAMTRSRNNLYLTYTGSSRHPYLNNFATDCNNIDIHNSLLNQGPKGGNVFGF
ncbi:MAG TPA: hypothetical protein DDY68_01205 [Porphyromonadaceae bacterium]|nr:hypothetical protein [Porphyromonadaceae bacterium]